MFKNRRNLFLVTFALMIAVFPVFCTSLAANGENAGQLSSKTGSVSQPVQSSANVDYSRTVSAAEDYFMAILGNTLWGWGCDNGIHLGRRYLGDGGYVSAPARIMDGAKTVIAGWGQTLVIKTDNTLWGWGDNMPSAGEERLTFALKPEKIMNDVISAACGDWHTLAVKKDGSLWAWGKEIGWKGASVDQGIIRSVTKPVKLMTGVKEVAAVDDGCYVLKADGNFIAWGNSVASRKWVKNPNGADLSIFSSNVKSIFAASKSVYYIKNDGSLWEVTEENYDPVKISDGIQAASASDVMPPMALKKNGTLIAWGNADFIGQIFGRKMTGELKRPVTVMTDVKAFSEGEMSLLVQKKDGSVYAWGDAAPNRDITKKLVRLSFSNEIKPLFQEAGGQKSKLLSDWMKEGEASNVISPFKSGAKVNWTGYWENNVLITGLTLRQNGSKVTGTDMQCLKFTGTIQGNRIRGYYAAHDVNDSKGILELRLSEDGKSFAGYLFLDSAAEATLWTGKKK